MDLPGTVQPEEKKRHRVVQNNSEREVEVPPGLYDQGDEVDMRRDFGIRDAGGSLGEEKNYMSIGQRVDVPDQEMSNEDGRASLSPDNGGNLRQMEPLVRRALVEVKGIPFREARQDRLLSMNSVLDDIDTPGEVA